MEDYEVFSFVVTLIAMAIPVIIAKIAGKKQKNDTMLEENQHQNIDSEPDFPSERYVVLSDEDHLPMFDEGSMFQMGGRTIPDEGNRAVYDDRSVMEGNGDMETGVYSGAGLSTGTDKRKVQSLKSRSKERKIIDDPKKLVIYSEIMTPKYKE